MNDGDLLTGILSLVVAMITWAPWYGDVFRVNRLAAPRAYRLTLGVMPLACLFLLYCCIRGMGAKAVRADGSLILLYVMLGAAALGVSSQLINLLGLSARDDALERRNGSALIAVSGALLGAMLCIAGGNIGEGPGVTVVIISGGTALVFWFALWFCADLFSGGQIVERITVERDLASGLRFAGLLIANGIILGAAAAGDWIADRFVHDFALSAWPVLALTPGAIVVERFMPARSSVARSVFVGLAYCLVAVMWVLHRGIVA